MKAYDVVFKEMGQRSKEAAASFVNVSKEVKKQALLAIGEALLLHSDEILLANEKDMQQAAGNIPQIMMDRLLITKERIAQMVAGIKELVELEDPVGNVLETINRPNGLHIKKVSVPLGVIAIIYEARPNVTVDAATLCLKTGNVVILRGGKEAYHTNLALMTIMQDAVEAVGLSRDIMQLVTVLEREAVEALLNQREYIDVVIPRGGAGLIKYIVETSKIPVIETGSGICHVYVDEEADIEMATCIIVNAKAQRPSVCNSAETLLIHKSHLEKGLPILLKALAEENVAFYGDDKVISMTQETSDLMAIQIGPVTDKHFGTEYNDLLLNVKIVDSLEEAILHINRYTTHHSECIITNNAERGKRFQAEIDAAAVYVNASTRFTDGFEFGFGAEIGISTQKLHARGPMGLRELTSYKYLIKGDGQIR